MSSLPLTLQPKEESFLREVERLRKIGAKYVTLKTGVYKASDLARAVKFASEAKIDLLTVDGAGGGTGMSPWRMMNEWGIPTVYIESLLYKFLKYSPVDFSPNLCFDNS